jgi:hypothetical protein
VASFHTAALVRRGHRLLLPAGPEPGAWSYPGAGFTGGDHPGPGRRATGEVYAGIGTLAAGASKTLTFAGLAAGAAGTKTLRAFVDSLCQTAEPNESNNQAALWYLMR